MAENEEKKSDIAKKEEEILSFWKENKVFETSLAKESPEGEYVFYDGPPFATGLPHYGSLLPSIAKDLIPRYKTMQGYYVRRRWGWDCHGLPIENMIEKEKGLKSKKEIIEMGEENFCNACEAAVLTYAKDWQHYIDRVARWVEFEDSYKTMDATYTESVWWALKQVNEKGLLYEGNKVLLYCPHCETPVSRAETAMDNSYKDVTDEAVTAEFRLKDDPKTSLLAWTTTPWTLPANVGLAVAPDVDYVTIEKKDAAFAEGSGEPKEGEGELVRFILAKELLEKIFPEDQYEIVKEQKGSELVGLEYEPLYHVPKVVETGKKAYYVMPADFVTTDDGTGVVHTAVMYGEDDYNLGIENDLPMVPLLQDNGHFNEDAPETVRGLFFKKANKAVITDLKERSLLFSEEAYTHSYPHCWRCKNALIYNAVSAWFINIQKVKSRIQENAKNMSWYPSHLKDGRFGKIVEGAPDWNISRNRFWASPLPFWKCEGCDNLTVVGGVDELKERMVCSNNKYYIARHGRSESNEGHYISSLVTNEDHLTDEGKEQAKELAQSIKDQGVDLIVTSDFMRTFETAEIVASELGLSADQVVKNEQFREAAAGEYEGKTWEEYHAQFSGPKEKWTKEVPNGENFLDVKRRVAKGLYGLEEKYEGKKILIVSHGLALEMMCLTALGASRDRSVVAQENDEFHFKNVEWREIDFKPLPHNNRYDLDLHKPYVDRITLNCECGSTMKRVPEVVDCWVESGSMPFAEYHYPFEHKDEFEKRFPGDYVVEYIAQTRTWFYYMLVMATVLFDKEPFKNVLVTGNILAEDGQKMSKSLKNYTDPLINVDRFGADALRFYLMVNPVMRGEDTNFKDEELKEVAQRLLGLLRNVKRFYTTYSSEYDQKTKAAESSNVLDKWILARLSSLHHEVTTELDRYDTVKAGRPLRDFVADLSQWYLRRSRDRFKGSDESDKQFALATTREVLLELSKIMAPFTPYIAEEIYQEVKSDSDPLSVHLCDWPKGSEADGDVLSKMEKTREIVSLALEKRSAAGIKVRQPLGKLTVSGAEMDNSYIALILDEVNVKQVVFSESLKEPVELDIEITPELRKEGQLRELLRHIQDLRKKSGLSPHDKINLSIAADSEARALIDQYSSEIKDTTGAISLEVVDGSELGDLDGLNLSVSLTKVN